MEFVNYEKDCNCDNCRDLRETALIGNSKNQIDGLPKSNMTTDLEKFLNRCDELIAQYGTVPSITAVRLLAMVRVLKARHHQGATCIEQCNKIAKGENEVS